MKKLNNKGFGHIEVLLVVLILAVVGFAGYYVMTKNDDKKAGTAATASTTTTPAKTTETTPVADTTKYLTIAQWSVKGKDSTKFKLNYAYEKSADGVYEYAKFNSTELAAAGDVCATEGSGGTIVRSKTSSDGATKVGDYYYSFAFGNGVCTFDEPGRTTQEEVRNAVKAVWESLVAS